LFLTVLLLLLLLLCYWQEVWLLGIYSAGAI
jgi:hypothetical protein